MQANLDQTELFHALALGGFERVAHVAEGSPNHNRIFSDHAPRLIDERNWDCGEGEVTASLARKHVLSELPTVPFRYYKMPPGSPVTPAVGYGYTANNRREFRFLQMLMRKVGADDSFVNLPDLKGSRRHGIEPWLQEAVMGAVNDFLASRPCISEAMMHHLVKLVASLQSAIYSLADHPANLFVVANDHSAAPVAHALVAQHLGMRTVYLQHAEVSNIFPPLEFDLSILRNQRSLDVYEDLAPPVGCVITLARERSPSFTQDSLNTALNQIKTSSQVPVVIYPSTVFVEQRLLASARVLAQNGGVENVRAKLHPNSSNDGAALKKAGVQLIPEVVKEPHVAITGSSSVVTELLARGNLVFHDPSLDQLVSDTYGFIERGLISTLDLEALAEPFWRAAPPMNAARFRELSRYIPTLATKKNTEAETCGLEAFREFLSETRGYPDILKTNRAREESSLT